jgi:hypothetical protein
MTEIEQQINTAIKGLTRRVNLKSEHLEIIENALGNPQITAQFWDKYLNGNNTKMALEQSIYTSEMIRLLTLRAIILPDTLLEFLEWLQNRPEKKNDHYQLSLDFQFNLGKYLSEDFPFITTNIAIGVQLIVIDLVNKPYLLEIVTWLLKSSQSLWSKIYNSQVRISLENKFALMSYFTEDNPNDFNLFTAEEHQLIRNNKKLIIIRKYKVLAELFAKLDDDSAVLAIFFYQISRGKVSSKIYQKIKPNLTKLFGITIKEQTNIFQKIFRLISNVKLTKIFRKEMLFCLGWMILWAVIYGILLNINPPLVFLAIIANLPLFSFFIIGLNLIALTEFILDRNVNSYYYDASYDRIITISFIVNFFITPYLLNYIYRYILFKNNRGAGFRIKEFFIWIIPAFLLFFCLNLLVSTLYD